MAIMQVNFYAKTLKQATTFIAIIPGDGPEEIAKDIPDAGLKSLYLLHGYTGNYFDWLWGSRIVELAYKNNIAVFLPSGHNSFYLDDIEKSEYYGEFIGSELVEYTRRIFPLSKDRDDTFIGGLSMGGYGALRNGLKYHNNFGKIIALSSAIIIKKIAGIKQDYKDLIADYYYYRRVFGDLDKLIGSDKDIEALAKDLVKKGEFIPEIYMACGTEDFLIEENRECYNHLKEIGINVTYIEEPGAHDWDFWNRHIQKAMEWLLKS